jgi:hypothetical protein
MELLVTFFLDPVVTRAIGATLSIVFLVGALQKLRDQAVFAAAVENYGLVPEALLPLVALVLPLVELAAGVLLLFPETCHLGGVLALLLLVVVTSAVAINLARGNAKIDCGCGGISGQPLSWALVGRNVLLMVLAGIAMQESIGRDLVWADYFTVAGAVLALVGLYVSVNQLMTTAPLALAVRK